MNERQQHTHIHLFQAVDDVKQYFKDNETSEAYFAVIPVDGNSKILSNVVTEAKKLGKVAYVLSADPSGTRVVHVNHVSQGYRTRGLDARAWATKVSEIVGGKAGGKEDGAQGVGTKGAKAEEALQVAKGYYDQFELVR